MKTTIGDLKRMVAAVMTEARGRVSPQEVLTTYEDIYLNSVQSNRAGDRQLTQAGVVPLETLASIIGATPEDVKAVLHKAGLVVDKNGNVVERGPTPPPMKAFRPGT